MRSIRIAILVLTLFCVNCAVKNVDFRSPPRDKEVDAAIDMLLVKDVQSYIEADKRLVQLGTRAVPILKTLLVHEDAAIVLRAIFVLDDIGDASAVPALVKIVDSEPDAVMSRSTECGLSKGGRAVRAREAVVHILDPKSRSWEWAEAAIPADSPAFVHRQDYHQHIKDWYDRWKHSGGEKGTRSNLPGDEKDAEKTSINSSFP